MKNYNYVNHITLIVFLLIFSINTAPQAKIDLQENNKNYRLRDYVASLESKPSAQESDSQTQSNTSIAPESKLPKYYESINKEPIYSPPTHTYIPPQQNYSNHNQQNRYNRHNNNYTNYNTHRAFYRRPYQTKIINNHYYSQEPETIEIVKIQEPIILTQEEQDRINYLLDVYEDRFKIFGFSFGGSSDSNGISGTHGTFRFNAPNTYSANGNQVWGWGLSFDNRSLRETAIDETKKDFFYTANHFFLHGNTTSLFKNTANRWDFRLGYQVLDGDRILSGPSLGLGYSFHNLDSIYSFNLNYDATFYNFSSSELEMVTESKMSSFFRVYTGPAQIDLGVELNVVDLEKDSQFHQFFIRTGFNF